MQKSPKNRLTTPARSRLRRLVPLLLWLQYSCFVSAQDSLPELSQQQWRWLGDRVFANECNRQPECLTSWNAGEEFPSLGIGHFIWYPAGSSGPFAETFPQLLDFLQQQGLSIPSWLRQARNTGAPWISREEFQQHRESPRMLELRHFLLATQRPQAEFIIQRFYESIPGILAFFPAEERGRIRERLVAIGTQNPPQGLYALIDYVHFKGTGLKVGERYQGQGWGLVQVLAAMDANAAVNDALREFTTAAARVLRQRVANSAPGRQEQRWLDGWLVRLRTYYPDLNPL